MIKLLKDKLKNIFLQTNIGYRFYLKYKWGVDKPLIPSEFPYENAVLKTRQEWQEAAEKIETLGLFSHSDRPKNWDSLRALKSILNTTDRTMCVLDAGATLYSVILPWLFLYGYKNLIGIDLTFDKSIKRGPIHYEYGDLTKTGFKDETFNAIACLSVIEHGVDLQAYFKEASRILKPNGILITSVDYYVYPVDTKGKEIYGMPVHIFSKDEIIDALNIAGNFNLELTDTMDLECQEKAISWDEFNLDYTFLIFTLKKK
jgi:SAM-dependent methyltransferase